MKVKTLTLGAKIGILTIAVCFLLWSCSKEDPIQGRVVSKNKPEGSPASISVRSSDGWIESYSVGLADYALIEAGDYVYIGRPVRYSDSRENSSSLYWVYSSKLKVRKKD